MENAEETTIKQTKAETKKKEKKEISPELLEIKKKALEKAVARKKELGLIKKAEQEQKKILENEKIEQAKNILASAQSPPKELKEKEKEKEKKIKVVEKVVEEEESSSDEEIVEKIVIKKVPKKKPQEEPNILEQTNKEILRDKLKKAYMEKIKNELFDF